jgi:hypothetical protein
MQTNQAWYCGRGWSPQRLTILELGFESSGNADRDWMTFPCGCCAMISLPPRPCVWLLDRIHLPGLVPVTKSRALSHLTIPVDSRFPLMLSTVCLALRFRIVLHSPRRSSNMHNFCPTNLSWVGIALVEFCHSNLAGWSLKICSEKNFFRILRWSIVNPIVVIRGEVKFGSSKTKLATARDNRQSCWLPSVFEHGAPEFDHV